MIVNLKCYGIYISQDTFRRPMEHILKCHNLQCTKNHILCNYLTLRYGTFRCQLKNVQGVM